MEEALRVTGLKKTFGSGDGAVAAIAGVDFTMASGAFEAIMGPSGSGKSTFLHLASGLLEPDAGAVAVGGHEITGLGDRELTVFRRRHLGLIFQDFNLIPTMTALENIELPLLLDGAVAGSAERIGEIAGMLGLGDRLSHLPWQLSGGERQRVAIARALAGNPEIVLADEPTGNLDSPAARRLCGILRDVNSKLGRSILVVSHDPVVAAAADRVHILRDGRFVETFEPGGDVSAVSARYVAAMGR